MTNPIYPFADLSLARRLENTEAHGNVAFVEARARAFPDSAATWTEIAGTYAMFDGPDSPVSQTFGLGIFQPVTLTTWARLKNSSVRVAHRYFMRCHHSRIQQRSNS